METKNAIFQAYKEMALESGKLPYSVHQVCQKAEVEVPQFHRHFNDLKDLSNQIWKAYFMQTVNSIEGSDVYGEYMIREKLLAFYYTLIEVLKEESTFVKLFHEQMGIWNYDPDCLVEFKPLFLAFLTELITEGRGTGEVEERYVVGDGYADWHWPQFLYLLNYWMRDQTQDQGRTDQAIEKAVNLGFDIMGHNIFDSAFDFARFLISKPKA